MKVYNAILKDDENGTQKFDEIDFDDLPIGEFKANLRSEIEFDYHQTFSHVEQYSLKITEVTDKNKINKILDKKIQLKLIYLNDKKKELKEILKDILKIKKFKEKLKHPTK